MRTLYTYPASFKQIAQSGEFLYTVKPGILITEAEGELEGILDSVIGVLRLHPVGGDHIESAQSLVEMTCDLIGGGTVEGETKSELFTSASNNLTDANNVLVGFMGEGIPIPVTSETESLYGVILLLNMAIGVCRSIAESCRRAGI